MAKKVKKAKRVRKVKMRPCFGWVYVSQNGSPWPYASWDYEESKCSERVAKYSLGEGSPRRAIVVADTPANRKRLGVKRA